MAWTADDLISLARELGRFPNDALSSANILAFADEVIRDHVLPAIPRESGYYVASSDTTVVSGTSAYRIPERARGQALANIMLVDSGGSESPMIEVPERDAGRYLSTTAGGVGNVYVMRGNQLIMLATPGTSGYSIRWYYSRLPNRLVLTTAAARVTSGGATASISVNAVPATFLTTTPLDYIQAKSGFDWLAVDKTPTGVGGPITFATAPSTEGVTGDYLALAGQTPIVQVPDLFFSTVAHGTAFYVLRALGDVAGAGLMRAGMVENIAGKTALLMPRNLARPQQRVNFNTPLRFGAFNRWGWGGR